MEHELFEQNPSAAAQPITEPKTGGIQLVKPFLGLSNRVKNFISSIFQREKEPRTEIKGKWLQDYSLFAAYGYQDIAEYLRLEWDLQSRYIDYEDMEEVPEISCLTGDSLIHTINGPISIKEMADSGKDYLVYSYDFDLRTVVLAKGKNARKTGERVEIWRVVLDDGRVIRGTKEHLFLMRSGDYVELGKLKPGDSIMPFLTRLGLKGYLEVFQPGWESSGKRKRWEPNYRIVGRFLFGRDFDKNLFIHHKDFDKLNDSPENLDLLTKEDHLSRHEEVVVKCADGHRISKDVMEKIRNLRDEGLCPADIAKAVGCSWSTAKRYSESKGYYNLDRFLVNHKVLKVEPAGYEDVYDFEVPEYHNFAVNGVFVHNSALDLTADDATQPDPNTGLSIWVDAQDGEIKKELNSMLHRNLRIEEEIWEIVRTLVKYGNEYEELLVTDSGVVGLNFLPPPTVRRVEKDKGVLLGFIQSVTGAGFNITAEQFEDYLKNPTKINVTTDSIFEDWMVMHIRLRSKQRRSKYGYSLLESARWIWKRLVMLEDAALIYKLCLRGDSPIWTTSGYKKIKDLVEGEEIYSFGIDGKLKKTKVVYKKYNGQDKIFRVYSKHREIFANKTHPILVEIVDRFGKGRKRVKRLEYVEVQNLIPGYHRFVMPKRDENDYEEIKLMFPQVGTKVRLSKDAIKSGIKMMKGIKYLQDNCGMQDNLIKMFFDGDYEVVGNTVIKVMNENGNDSDCLDFREDWGGVKSVNLPRVVDEDFARWFGFMIGDGFIAERHLGFALGDNEIINERYKKLFEKFVGEVSFSGEDESGRFGSYYVYSKKFVEFMIMNGFIPGAHNKRVPEWVYRAKNSIKLAFLEGFIDADGHRRTRNESGGIRNDIEVCNKVLLEDIRQLCMQLGVSVGKISERVREGHLFNGRMISRTVSYGLTFSLDNFAERSEPILGIEEVGADDIWDIGVDSDEHNFVDDGVVVHNTRAPARYAFYVDVGELPPQEAIAYVEKVRQFYKKKKVIDPQTNRLDTRFNVLSSDEDFFVPTRKGKEGSKIDVLEGPSWQGIEELEYFRSKLFSALKIPKAYLGYEESINAKATLAQEDIRWARSILRIQREIRQGFAHICRVHLAARNIDPEVVEFDVEMTVPSAVFEMAKLEVETARAELAEKMGEYVSRGWIMRNIFGFSDEEVEIIAKEKAKEEGGGEEEGAAGESAEYPRRAYGYVKPGVGLRKLAKKYPLATSSPLVGDKNQQVPLEIYLSEGNKDMEKYIEDNFQKIARGNRDLMSRLNEIRSFMTELKYVIASRRA
jgi:intein/homing endonuclease